MDRASDAKVVPPTPPPTVVPPYELILEQMPDSAILAFDTDLRFTAAAGPALADMGWTAAELVGRRLDEIVTGEHLDRLRPMYERALHGETVAFESRGVRRESRLNELSIVPLRGESAAIVGGLLVAREVSEARRQAEMLRISEERARRLAEESSDMQAIYSPDGVYLEVSSASGRLFGWEPEELVGRSSYEWFHPDDLAAIRAAHEFVLEIPETTTVSYRFRCKDGSYSWVEVIGRSIFDPIDGSVVAIQCTTRDISERRDRETREERQRTDMAVATLAGAIAHQLNSMLTAVIGGLELARRDAPHAAGLVLARSAAEQAADVGRRLLAISGHHGMAARRFDVVEQITALAPSLSRAGGPKTTVTLDLPDQPIMIRMDDGEFGLLLIELIRSLGASTTERQEIRMSIAATESDRLRIIVVGDRASLPAPVSGSTDESTIVDGIGMGLGIAAVQSIVKSHGGSVSYEHPTGAGATVRVELPLPAG